MASKGNLRKRLGRLRNTASRRARAARTELIQRLRNPRGTTRPVFLIGSVRSGTSMIVRQLAKSWQVRLYNEDHPAAFDHWRLRDLTTIKTLLAKSPAPVTLFKPILDTHRALDLLAGFPEARLLFAFRDFDDVVNSARKRFYAPDDSYVPSSRVPPRDPRDPVTRWMATDFAEFEQAPPPAESIAAVRALWRPDLELESNIALRWLFINRMFFDLGLNREPRLRLVRYEDVVADPVACFSEITGFLGMSYDAVMSRGVYDSSVGKDDIPDIDPGIRAACERLLADLIDCREGAPRDG